jgi:arylsulfatase A-like enzyme
LEDRLTWALADAVEPAARAGRSAVHSRVRFAPGAARRTVLLVTIDALRADAVEPGRPLAAHAPELAVLGRGALRFSRAYSPGNKTPIAVPGIVLGALPAADEAVQLADSIASPFNRGGYETDFFFTSHEYANLEPTPLWPLASRGFGFQRYHREYLSAPEILGRARKALETSSAPRFVWVHLSDMHSPFLLGGASRGDPLAEAYPRALATLDGVLARFLDRFRQENPDAIWALSSDHGESLGERGVLFHGSSLFDEQIRVPLLLGGPGVSPGLVERPVGLAALGATLAVLAGAKAEADVPLLPMSRGDRSQGYAPVLSAGIDACAWIDFPYKLIADAGKGTVALYDLERDPAESRNLIADSRGRAAALMAALLRGGCPYDLNALSTIVLH